MGLVVLVCVCGWDCFDMWVFAFMLLYALSDLCVVEVVGAAIGVQLIKEIGAIYSSCGIVGLRWCVNIGYVQCIIIL